MHIRKLFFRSFKLKVTIAFIASMLFVGVLSNFLVYRLSLKAQFEQLQEKLKVIAQTSALIIDPDVLAEVPLNREGLDTLQYKIIAAQLIKIKQANPPILSVYILTKTDKEGVLQFIADAEIPNQQEIQEGITFYPGDRYDARRFPQMLEAFKGTSSVDNQIGKDEWGLSLSGYAPIRNRKGSVMAIIGVDISAKDISEAEKAVHFRAIIVLFLSIAVSILVALLLSKNITGPIEKLVEGTHNLTTGNLNFQVKVRGEDEISQLSKSFNEMAASLYDSREKLHNYFYNVLQAFVRILEASDEYTEGHSKRVSEYAGKIASRMGLSEDKIELLKEAALLHDIGKVGIEKGILNKKEPLTASEWQLIKRHPVVGEEMVKSVVLNKEMLSVIRSHHERLDGKGYPDGLSGEEISIFAAIISVADAYDAMVSNRAYRNALSREDVFRELKNNRNSQFNSKVVDVLLEIVAGINQ